VNSKLIEINMLKQSKVKIAIEVSIYAIGGIQNTPESELYVKWTRGKNSIETKR
jgi:hypothetical protein